MIVAELSLPAGGVSGGCSGVPAPGADPVELRLADGRSAIIDPEAFADFGPTGALVNHGMAALSEPGARLHDLDAFLGAPFEPLAVVAYFKTHVAAIDLADLGVESGEEVARLAMGSTGRAIETESGRRLCWTADPAFVVGLARNVEN